METEYYRNFITIVEKGNILSAAESIGIADSALSKQLANIEAEYGAKLIKTSRGVKYIQLTEAGQIFYKQIKLLCGMEKNIHQDITNCTQGYTGTLKFTVSPALSPALVRNQMSAFHKDYPEISFRMKEAAISQQEMFLKSDLVEFGIANSPLQHKYEFEVLKERNLQYYVIVHPSTQWLDANKKYIEIQELADIPLCLTESSCQGLLDIMADKGINTKILSMFTNRKTSLLWAEKDYGIAVYPTYEADTKDQNLTYIPLRLPELIAKQIIYKVKGKKLSSLAEKFIEYLGEK